MWSFSTVFESIDTPIRISPLPFVKSALAHLDLLKGSSHTQRGCLDKSDDFILLLLTVLHIAAQPYFKPVKFFYIRFFRPSTAAKTFSASFPSRRSFASVEVASRVVPLMTRPLAGKMELRSGYPRGGAEILALAYMKLMNIEILSYNL
jgi:hypothetical protein